MRIVTEPAYLTPRESDVLRLVARGRSYAQIGKDLGVSPHTVTSHIKNAYRKLGVCSGAAAVMRALELKLLGEGSPCHADGVVKRSEVNKSQDSIAVVRRPA